MKMPKIIAEAIVKLVESGGDLHSIGVLAGIAACVVESNIGFREKLPNPPNPEMAKGYETGRSLFWLSGCATAFLSQGVLRSSIHYTCEN